jgi:MinD-like ATPase involved in chromosome partitioning or flagellar assembly
VDEPRIALAASPREWAQALHRHVADHGGARVRATVLHQRDAVAEDYDVFVADDATSFLTPRLVAELHRTGRSVLGVFDPDDPRGKGELLDMGVDDVIARDAGPAAFVSALVGLHGHRRRPAEADLDLLVRELTGEVPATRTQPAAAVTVPGPPPADGRVSGLITAVGATGGGTGATEVAIALALAIGSGGDATVLVDADEVAPSLAQRLALPPYPNLRAAVDALEQAARPLPSLLAAAGPFAVLPGLSAPRGWAELRPLPAVEVLEVLAETHRHVVANVGPRLEDVQGVAGGGRYGVTREVLRRADAILGVAQPSPTGMARLLGWLGEVRELAPATPVHVLFNKTPASAFKRGELQAELERTASPASIWFAPADARVERAAWDGCLPPAGPFTRAAAEAAAVIAPSRVAPSRRRWVRA